MNKKIYFYVIGFFILILIAILTQKSEIIFEIEGKEAETVFSCENFWHYEKLLELNRTFLPCIFGGGMGGMTINDLNFSLDPNQNCKRYNSTFVGFNIKNESINKEILDKIKPTCYEIKKEDIVWDDLEGSCKCIKSGVRGCSEYQCNNLKIKRKLGII